MTYFFSGVIGFSADLDFRALGEAIGGVTRAVAEPFEGYAHAFAADYSRHELDTWERARLEAWSRARPGEPVVYLNVECFGGACDQAGFLMRDGAARLTIDANAEVEQATVLERLLDAAGHPVEGAFMPFLERRAFNFSDADHMRRAFALARAQFGRTGDNPAVGCVIVERGAVAAEGATADGGRPHAEQDALSQLGGAAKSATAYVTLEPCRERSSGEPSCSERLIAAGVSRVVYAVEDRHPRGSGGVERLREAGVTVERLETPEAAEALYADFFKSVD
ncbi:MAG: bifunctional diaminohydroxyphosphoribosylaminopyrimidine deaminase/5-amino-6-(5-phosphoribosylamino)uracil reductase RibD [Pseudomonadota bacterium]